MMYSIWSNFHTLYFKYIFLIQTFSEDVRCILNQNKDVPDINIMLDILSIGKINGAKDLDTYVKTKEYMSKLPKATLNVLLDLYKEDFDLGGYTFKDYG